MAEDDEHEHGHEHKHVIHKEGKKLKIGFDYIYISLVIVLAAVVIYNSINIGGISTKLETAKEAAIPAKIQIATIGFSKCSDCFDISSIVDSIKNGKRNITSEEALDLSDEKAQQYVVKYKIKKLPTVLVFGEIDKAKISGLVKEDDALIFTDLKLPYLDIDSGEVKGRVSAISISDASCGNCSDISLFIFQVKESGVKIANETGLDVGSLYGKELLQKYSIKKIPTVIFSKDIDAYDEIKQAWSQLGTVESDGSYVLRTITPPYKDLDKNRFVTLILLDDKSCDKCYDPTLHKPILANYGVKLIEEKTVDISDAAGKALVAKYKIELVPTIILSEDADAYMSLKQVWTTVGTVESDGTFVFRNVAVMQRAYKNLTSGSIIEAQAAQG